MRSILFVVLSLVLIAFPVIADDLSSLAKASKAQIVAAARADAEAYYAMRKKAGKRVNFSDAYSYGSGRAIMRDLTDSNKKATYTNAFHAGKFTNLSLMADYTYKAEPLLLTFTEDPKTRPSAEAVKKAFDEILAREVADGTVRPLGGAQDDVAQRMGKVFPRLRMAEMALQKSEQRQPRMLTVMSSTRWRFFERFTGKTFSFGCC